MIKYQTCFVPPKEYEKNEINCEWTRSFVIEEVCKLHENNVFNESEIQSYESMLVAYDEKRIIGFQLCDYDPYEMSIVLGRQILSLALNEDELEGLKDDLGHIAKMRYEDLY